MQTECTGKVGTCRQIDDISGTTVINGLLQSTGGQSLAVWAGMVGSSCYIYAMFADPCAEAAGPNEVTVR
ncbi:hypothetical protein K340107D12_52980 [Blautia parvula]|uniref:Uncharacterized protein n=1 Tax=Blautia parvula TaxID=2877527 RepID=A0ABQ0C112_9FIRM